MLVKLQYQVVYIMWFFLEVNCSVLSIRYIVQGFILKLEGRRVKICNFGVATCSLQSVKDFS